MVKYLVWDFNRARWIGNFTRRKEQLSTEIVDYLKTVTPPYNGAPEFLVPFEVKEANFIINIEKVYKVRLDDKK